MELVETTFTCGAICLRLLAAPGEEPTLDCVTDPERIPYWSVLWPTGAALTAWLVTRGGWSNLSVLELGCGAGLAGLALAAAGARVMQTDLFPDAVRLAQLNAVRNGLTTVRQAAGDWHAWPFRNRWPVIVGSDLTYERASHEPLLNVIEQALAPGGTAFLADPGRPMTLDFLTHAEQQGWDVALEALPPRPGGTAGFLYQLRR